MVDRGSRVSYKALVRRGLTGLLFLLAAQFSFSTPVHALEGDETFCLYKQASLQGDKACGSYERVRWMGWQWHRKTSSLEIKEGYEMVAFAYPWLQGPHTILSGENLNLGEWNNRIASFYMRRTTPEQELVCFYTKKDFRGRRFCTDEDQYYLGWKWYNKIRSISIPSGYEVTLYRYYAFQGRSVTFTSSVPKLNGRDRRIGSIEIDTGLSNLDSDGDGVTDDLDLCPDTMMGEVVDADGCAASQRDTDGDGFNDDVDVFPNDPTEWADLDGDGIGDNSDPDIDGDGVNNEDDAFPRDPTEDTDTDGDGIGDNTDPDIDGDGFLNEDDAFPFDPTEWADLDGDGIGDNSDPDIDGDGVNNEDDAFPRDPTEDTDTDGDGIGDNSDPDIDGDGFLNEDDAFPFDPAEWADLDGDGIGDNSDPDIDGDGVNNEDDAFPRDPTEDTDTDGDGIGDNSDPDIDGDGVLNEDDAFPFDPTEDTDTDGDGIGDNSDPDIDGDGVLNENDAFPFDPTEDTDTDGDGIGDNSDPDIDGDGVLNEDDAFPFDPTEDTDTDGDGIGDNTDPDIDGDGVLNEDDAFPFDATEDTDTDGDGIGDNSDPDIDGDGVLNEDDAFPFDPTEDTDTDGDGIGDNTDPDIDGDGVLNDDDVFPFDPTESADLDGDGIGDNSDPDIDGDGVNNEDDAFPRDPNETTDTDGDGIGDNSDPDIDGDGALNEDDAFPFDPNETTDTDGDGIGDNSDPDIDGDGVLNENDAFPFDPTEDTDTDGDGVGDNTDPDIDGDGALNEDDAFPFDPTEDTDTDGDGVGDNSDPDIDGDGVLNDNDAFPFDPNESADLDGDGVGDNSDPDVDGDGVPNELDDFPRDPTQSAVSVELEIISPVNGFVTTASQIEVVGIANGPFDSVRVEGVDAPVVGGEFRATIVLHEGANKLTAVGLYQTARGEKAASSTTNAIQDLEAPVIVLSSIRDGLVTTESQITIAGTLEDIRSDLSNTSEATVTINGTPVAVVNRSFELGDFLLRPGLNAITVTAEDSLGNASMEVVNINFLDNAGQRVVEIQGNNQASTVGMTLPEPLVVKLVDRNDVAIEGRAVTFRVSEGDGQLADLPRQGRELTVITNEQGLAEVDFQLGSRDGAGRHQVSVGSIGFPGEIVFCASADALPPSEINISRGNYQTGVSGNILPEPLVAKVIDSNANNVAGVDVLFEVQAGAGSFSDTDGTLTQQLTRTSDVDGNVSVDFILGGGVDNAGVNAQRVRASIVGQPEDNVNFNATAQLPGVVSDTSVVGIVLDNSNAPLPAVQVSLTGNFFTTVTSTTDDEGRFVFADAPVGTLHLDVDASTTTAPGDWPKLSFQMVTISGRENSIGMPVFVPKLDTAGAKVVGGNEQVTIPMAGVDGAAVIIAPNSVTLPDGSRQGMMMFSQVQTDKVPMPAPNGTVFDVAWTLQPAGTRFDPPARVSLPNSTSTGRPGEEIEMFTFDHDMMEWISIGPGVVSEDGSRIVSKAGFGIRESGWGGAPPDPDDTCNINCDDTECEVRTKQDCFCDSMTKTDTEKSEQIEGNCQTELCDGSRPADDLTDEDRMCNKCEDGSVVGDESKNDNKCGDQSDPMTECLVCKDGNCGPPDCDASSTTSSISVENDQLAADFFRKINAVASAHPLFTLEVNTFANGSITKGEECCMDCTKPTEKGDYFRGGGTLGARITAAIGPRRDFMVDWDSPSVFGYSVDFEVSAEAALEIGVEGEISAGVGGKYNPTCDEGCLEISAGASLTPFAQAVAGINEFDFEVDGPGGSEFDIIDVTSATAQARFAIEGIGINLSASRGNATECGGGSCQVSFGGGSFTIEIGNGSVELLEIFEFNLPTFSKEFELWEGGSTSCG